ncbi:MAG: 2-hydroxyacyl-CoA dehydratase [Clostridia bacterium]|nr:2-hydroxyacyl-CoA dehydratase [Clostridia bacterium]
MDKIYTMCKYTPNELLAGFGMEAVRLDPVPQNFDCADTCLHPNLCGYGKAVMEAIEAEQIRCLILVDCCDVCRRLFDVLSERGNMDFLFLLGLPHKNGPAEIHLFEGELNRLIHAIENLTGHSMDEEAVLQAWDHADASKNIGKHITVRGAHGGRALMEMIRERYTLPVQDETCTGNRRLEKGGKPFSMARYASALLEQDSACMRMQFKRKRLQENCEGIIFHTVKFCDYYGFEYRYLKEENMPILKIETDCTAGSSGQMKTRLDAFAETAGGGLRHINSGGGHGYVAGVDSGSASTDAVILNKNAEIVGSAVLPTGAGAAAGAGRALQMALQDAGLTRGQLDAVVTTGYGRETIGLGDSSITEITCHAHGAHFLFPEARTVIDIGGQDSKVIRLDADGHVENFVMNDKCAAGTGRFLDLMAKTLEISLDEMSEMGLKWQKEVVISSMCTVFAESEVVSLIANNTAPADIIHGLNLSVASKTASLVKRAGGEPAFVMTGGVAKNKGVVHALEEKLDTHIQISEYAQLCGALGAALFALGK